MKKVLLLLSTTAILVIGFSSCAATKRDCMGAKHIRLSNGIYL